MSLEQWGFHPDLLREPLASGEICARVVEEQKTQYRLATERGLLPALLAGRLLRPSIDRLDRPVVGDWVIARAYWDEGKAVIQTVLPRQSLLRRKAAGETEAIQPLAANVDLTVIVSSLNKEFNEKRLHRYLTVAQSSGSAAALLLTKVDLAPESRERAAELSQKYSIPCFAICALSGEGLEQAKQLLQPGKTAVFVGSSGVGKSTLVNALLGRSEQETSTIREDDDRGRHTTTSRRLIQLESGALVIDTPGLREIQLEAGQDEGLAGSFAPIEDLATECKFSNCSHETEPGCRVKAALASGELAEADYQSYLKLRAELAFQLRKTDKAAAAAEKQKWKSINKAQRAGYKERDKGRK
ncbi:MAG TPA: ribosome small subunit-dependent GTPase A [Bdellovibrionota bacterium]|jgi:ribosome biogenesis GTPase